MATSTTSPLLAGTFGDCCFSASVKHEGDPVGRVDTIAGFQTYVSDPPVSTTGPKKVVLYLSDVYGPFLDSIKLLQDFYASNGFYVLGVDYFFGEYISQHEHTPGFDRTQWAENKLKYALGVTDKWIDAVRTLHGQDAKYFAVGYCFGGPFTMNLAATDKITAAAFAHPAFLSEDHFKNVKCPLLMSCAETDHTFPTSARHRAEDILAEIKATYHVQVFSGVLHGFTRGDKTVENIRWAREQSAQSVMTWFNRFAQT
ncbi:hypothetical protein HYPSUDRAFT_139718 [Hypholoma sublateritium FD-334 SS-4]|uniref:Dienelactone hydrolase domain-containing protein n=1 Tax=Hypholoma sublateritium (strain FD-334 SS-4) TaxID=945553 RepID=A0A0D2MEL9_HYPSF|nr:hypothetical protein HYPSUDRAFT_139718 [Hypholoma sublateritium FD-334 SS-4]